MQISGRGIKCIASHARNAIAYRRKTQSQKLNVKPTQRYGENRHALVPLNSNRRRTDTYSELWHPVLIILHPHWFLSNINFAVKYFKRKIILV